LKVREQFGSTLDLIEDGTISDLAKEGAGVFCGESSSVWILKGKVGKIGGQQSGKRRFSRLTWPRDGQNREAREALAGGLGKKSGDLLVRAWRGSGFWRHG